MICGMDPSAVVSEAILQEYRTYQMNATTHPV